MAEQASEGGTAVVAPQAAASVAPLSQQLSWVARARSKIEADPELIRGMTVQDLLRGFASILGSNRGTADDYGLSRQLSFIETFLSHNWSTPRLHKFLVLVLHYNLIPALFVTLVVSAALLALMMLELLPNATVRLATAPDTSFTRGLFCLPVGTLVFFVTLFSVHEVTRYCCPSRNRTVFLDKTCINQIDPELKMKGIQSLAAFLSHSGELLVVFTDTYMQKLWTVYEVATWLMLHRGTKMVVRPTYVPRLLLVGNVVMFLIEVLWLLLNRIGYTEPETMTPFVLLVCAASFCFPTFTALARIVSLHAQERDNISEHLAKFKFSNAKCFSEDDRKVVQENIVVFMKSAGTCSAEASDEEAIEAFEALARRVVPKAMEASFGRVGVPYTYFLAANLPRSLMHMDRAVGLVVDSVPAYAAFWDVFNHLFEVFVITVLVDAYLLLCMKCKRLRNWCGCVFVGVSAFLGGIVSGVIFYQLTKMAVDSPVWHAVHLPLRALLGAVAFLLYRPVRASPVQQTR